MKSKISSLSNSGDFKNLLNGRKISNPYSTIFFKKLSSKNSKLLNVSFVTKLIFSSLLFFDESFLKNMVEYAFEIFLPPSKFLKSSLFERLEILLFIIKLKVFFYLFFYDFLAPSVFFS